MAQTFPCLEIESIIGLPVAIESHAQAIAWNGDLWILNSKTGIKETQLLKITRTQNIEIISLLPIVLSFAVACENKMILSGANKTGQRIIIGVDSKGQIIWEYNFQTMVGSTWPAASCGSRPLITWEKTSGAVEVALLDIESGTLIPKTSIKPAGSQTRRFVLKDKHWVAWIEEDGIHVIDVLKGTKQVIYINDPGLDLFSVSQCTNGTYFGWTIGENVYWLLPVSLAPKPLIVKNVVAGSLKLVGGGAPLIWIQNPDGGTDEDLQWQSKLIMQAGLPTAVSGYVYDVAWWAEKVAVVNGSKVLLFKEHAIKTYEM